MLYSFKKLIIELPVACICLCLLVARSENIKNTFIYLTNFIISSLSKISFLLLPSRNVIILIFTCQCKKSTSMLYALYATSSPREELKERRHLLYIHLSFGCNIFQLIIIKNEKLHQKRMLMGSDSVSSFS